MKAELTRLIPRNPYGALRVFNCITAFSFIGAKGTNFCKLSL